MSDQSTPDQAYFDRNQAVMLAAKLAERLGWVVGIKEFPDDADWPVIYIEAPTGQLSWHIPAKELVGKWPEYQDSWDGHSVEEKRARIIKLLE